MRPTYIPICNFIETFCQTDESKPMLLDPWQKEILSFVFTPDKRGKLKYKTVIWSSPKKCLPFDSEIVLDDGTVAKVGELLNREFRVRGFTPTESGISFDWTDASVSPNGEDTLWHIKTFSGRVFTATWNHPVWTRHGWRLMHQLMPGQDVAVDDNDEPWDMVESSEKGDPAPTFALTTDLGTFVSANGILNSNTAKTSLSAAIDLWFAVCMSQDDGEIYVVANARQQAKERAFTKIRRMIQKSPELRQTVNYIQTERIEFKNGTIIQAISSDAGSIAGANPELVHQDELWSGCFPLNSGDSLQVLSRNGWVDPAEISTATELASLTAAGELHYECPKALYRMRYDGPMYRFRHRRAEFLVTPKHRVFGAYANGGNARRAKASGREPMLWEFKTAEEASQSLFGWLKQDATLKGKLILPDYPNHVPIESDAHVEWERRMNHWSVEDYHGEIWCPEMPSGVFYVRYNGHCFWTGNTTPAQERLFEELTPVYTRKNSFRLVSSYAGFEGQSRVLERLYSIAMKGNPVLSHIETNGEPVCRVNDDAALMSYWDNIHRPSWCQEGLHEYLNEQRATLSRMAFMRLHENRWVSSNEGIDTEDWDACVAEFEEIKKMERLNPQLLDPHSDRKPRIVLGVDASYSGDRTAVVALAKKDGRLWYLPEASRTWHTKKGEITDPKDTAGKFVISLKDKYRIAACFYDPSHFVSVAMWLARKGVRMTKVSPTEGSAATLGNGLVEALRFRKLLMPYDKALRDEAISVSLKLGKMGMKIEKGRHSAKVDTIAALALAIMAAERLPDVGDALSQIVFFGNGMDASA